MGKSNRKKGHRVKPVNKTINYYTNILKIIADERIRKSENEIFNALTALDEGLNFKRDAIDAIHIMSKNQILNITISENHKQRYDVQLALLGDELVSLWKNMERSFAIYNDLEDVIKKNFIVEQDMNYDELKAKLLSKNWKIEDIPYHNQWLNEALNFMVKTLYAIILTLSTSYIRFLSKLKDNEPAKAILNYIFSETLKQGLSFTTSKQAIFINDVLAQMELPLTQYFVDFCYNKELHGNKLLEAKPQNLLNSIYSIIEPGKDMNINNLLRYIMTLKQKSVLFTQQDLPPL